MKIYYDFLDKTVQLDIDEIVIKCIKEQPAWFKKLTPYSGGHKTKKSIFNFFSVKDMLNSIRLSTAKKCPGFVKLFSQSALLKFPCDVIIETLEDGSFYYKCSSKMIDIDDHSSVQAPILLDDFIAIKFVYNLAISPSKKTQFNFIDPVYYKKQNYIVAPGILESYGTTPLNVIALFPKEHKKYLFSAGEPLALLQSNEKITKIEEKNLNKQIALYRGKAFNKLF